VIPFEFRHDLWRQKTRVMGLSCGVVCVILCLAVLIQYRSVTDRHTHRHTMTAYTALSIASRGKNWAFGCWRGYLDFIWDPTVSADCFRCVLKTYLFGLLAHSAHHMFLMITAQYKSISLFVPEYKIPRENATSTYGRFFLFSYLLT